VTYAIISLGGKQYRVQQGQRLLVDRLAHAEGKTFHPDVLFVGGDGKAEFAPKGQQVTVKVVGDALGEKIRIGKYKKRTGYRRHTGHRAKLTRIEITAIGAKTAARPASDKPAAKPRRAAKPAAAEAAAAGPKAETAAAKPKPAAAPKPKAAGRPRTKARADAKAKPPQEEGAE